MHEQHTDGRVGLVAVGFSLADRLAGITRHLGWTHPVLADPDRALYRRLDVGRAPWWRVYSPGTVATYARAFTHGHRPPRPVEDTRQLGADAILVDGRVTLLWRPRSPDDRPAAADLLAATAAELEARGTDGGFPGRGR